MTYRIELIDKLITYSTVEEEKLFDNYSFINLWPLSVNYEFDVPYLFSNRDE